MSEQKPLQKPIAHHLGPKIPNRPISSGYELKSEISPELQRNIPSVIPEATKNEKNEKDEKSKKDKLNINAPSFHPRSKPNYTTTNTNEPKKMGEPIYKKPLAIYNNNKNYNNNSYQYYQQMNNNINYGNHNYYPSPQQSYVYNNIPPQQMGYQQSYYANNIYMNQNAMPAPPYNNYNINKAYNTTGSFYQKSSYNPAGTMSAQKTSLTTSSLANTKQTTSLKMAEGYIPKSMRNKEEPPANLNLNLKASKYIPTNVKLKEKEEQIQKMQNENKGLDKEEDKKDEKQNDKNDEKKEEKQNNEKIPEQPKEKEETKEPNANKDKTQNKEEENKAEQKEKKNPLKMLLESNTTPSEGKKQKEKPSRKPDNESLPNYRKNKKGKTEIDKKIDLVNEKNKKLKEEEEKRKREEEKKEKKRKEEEKKKRDEEKRREEEEEKKRKKEEEERKKKEEEENKIKMELEEKRKEEERKKKEEERKRKEEEEKNKYIEKKYFIVFKNKKTEKKEYKYTFEYIMQFRKWKIANEDDLLTEEAKQHFEDFKEEERDGGKNKKRDNQKPYNYKSNKNIPNYNKTKEEQNTPAPTPSSTENTMEQWARKDMTNEIKAAEEFKHKLEETIKDDPVKRNLRSFLNMLTKDNYEKTKEHILEIIKDNIDYQGKFLDVLFQKAVSETAYVQLYARLCKELDKELPQKNQPKEGEKEKKKLTSVMRAQLLDKCREIFQIENNEKFDEYIKEKDPEERENKLKKFVLGNVYFITELIKIKILSKKIAPVCIRNLFKRYENSAGDEKLKLINIQAIVIFTDQFGTLVHSQGKKIDSKDAKAFKDSIEDIFVKLEKIKDEKGLPGHIKYSIINLIEKKKNNYQRSKLEEYRIAKSKKEVEQEIENQEQINQDYINDKIKKDLSEYRDFIEEEGSSDKYPWKETTYLYDKKGKTLDDLLEGYIASCGDFIEKESNIKYAKDYIKELIEYYGENIQKKEKTLLKNRLFKLLELVRDFALETPAIYDIYSYVIFIFIDNNIIEIPDLEDIINEKEANEEDYKVISSIFEKAYEYYKDDDFKEEVAKFEYVKNNSHLFNWLYLTEDNNEEEEKEKNEE